MKVYDVRRTDGRWTPSDGKSSHGIWPGELKKIMRMSLPNIPITTLVKVLSLFLKRTVNTLACTLEATFTIALLVVLLYTLLY